MSTTAAATPQQIIEHIVLYKVKSDTDPSKTDSMITHVSSLSSLEQIVHLSTGPLLRTKSSPFPFTHLLHTRYKSKQDLDAYLTHPSHVAVVTNYVKPIGDDIMVVDWVANDLSGPVATPPGSAMRVTFLKLKEGLGENDKARVLDVIGGIKRVFPVIDQISCGENFSMGRAKGFSIGSIAVLPGLSELEAMDSESERANLEKDKVRDSIESVIVLDYVVPQQPSASLR
ncbi:hypothetical protein Vadar_010162 [Vaccinium darrowii]|uniref:Uncharacterized protein n=1 Tax=Vaccinium darrowii TaxID=229202 RepID=A0ACB7YKK2_9ERIC|nr:hypothetical protein Vadar_010162 [Vaccinium darrowii]